MGAFGSLYDTVKADEASEEILRVNWTMMDTVSHKQFKLNVDVALPIYIVGQFVKKLQLEMTS